jgi:hypothetical protein
MRVGPAEATMTRMVPPVDVGERSPRTDPVPLTPDARPAEFRYGVVFGLVVVLLVFLIVAPDENWSVATALFLEGAALLIAVATARERRVVRRRRALATGVASFLLIVGVATGALPAAVGLAACGILALAIPLALGDGLLRLVRTRGVTLHAVAGSLTIYLLVGLTFAWTIGFAAHVGDAAFFAEGTDASSGQRVYYSFTVLTTTGFGDLTPAGALGRALAVLEMLLGQLYLVTVLGVVVSNFARRR